MSTIAEQILAEWDNAIPANDLSDSLKLPSAHQHGDNVWLNLWGNKIIVEIDAVIFYVGKICYHVKAFDESGNMTYLKDIDSSLLCKKRS